MTGAELLKMRDYLSRACAQYDDAIHVSQVGALSEETGLALCAIDNIIWSFCADGYGEICTATPHCERCVVRGKCKYATDHQLAFSYDPNVISYDELRSICEQLGNDPARIGQHILSLIK